VKILYVSGMAAPIKDLLSGKKEDEITHASQYFHVWHKLVKRGYQVDFIVASNFNEKPNIIVDWFSEKNIYANVYDPPSELPWYRRIFRRIKRFSKLLYYTNKAISENHYDFIYCHSYYEGLAGNIIANLRGVPCGMRSMGTMLNEDFKKYGVFRTALKRPIEFCMFKMNKEFFIMTDDGTKGDVVYEAWKPRPEKYKYCFWKTGIDIKSIAEIKPTLALPKHEYLFFAARFDNWKRHDRIVKILHLLHQNEKKLHLYFAGGIVYDTYYNEIQNLVNEYKLKNYVHFLGAIKQDDVKNYAYHAVANPLLYDVSNLGNVFFEIFSVGAVVIGKDDDSLNDYIRHTENGFIVKDEIEACNIIEQLILSKDSIEKIRINAIDYSKRYTLSKDVRFNMEVDLIEESGKVV